MADDATKEKKLFEAVLKVIREPEKEPVVTFLFPETNDLDPAISSVVPLFCFPEGSGHISKHSEKFSFILTGGDGSKQFGYCWRFLDSKVPQCYCILSYIDSFSLFSSILEIVGQRDVGGGHDSMTCFLCSLLSKPVPQPGETLSIQTFSDTNPNELDSYTFYAPLNNDFLLEYISFAEIFSSLGIDNVINLFEAMILECRIVFVSKKLSQLSACVSAAVALLNPLAWQYVYIPILPSSLLTYCCAPMPFVVGVSESSLAEIQTMPTEELLVVHCDQGKFIQKPEKNSFLTDEMRTLLRKSLSRISVSCKKGDKIFDLHIARCFVNFMYRLFGNYYKFMNEEGVLDNEIFLECQPPQFQAMIEVLQSSQMWEGFLCEREIWQKNNLLESCVLLKEAYNVWCVEDLSLVCCKCKNRFTENGHTKSGRYYCHPCFEQKFTLIDRKLLNSSSTKMKKVGKNFTRRVRSVANDIQHNVPSSLNRVTSEGTIFEDAKKPKIEKPEKSKKELTGSQEPKYEGKFPYMKSSLGIGKSKKRSKSVTTGKPNQLPADEPACPSPAVKMADISNVTLRATQSFAPRTKPSEQITNSNCAICERKVLPADALRCESKIWHRNCAPCSRCLLPITNECKMVEDKVYHPGCPPLRLMKAK